VISHGFFFTLGAILAVVVLALPAIIILRLIENWQYKQWQIKRKDDLRIIKQRLATPPDQERGFIRKGPGC
jgi:hypothetical protein